MSFYFKLRKEQHYWVAHKLMRIFPELASKYEYDAEELAKKLYKTELEFYSQEQTKTSFLMRLTLPFALIMMLLMIVYMPIQYIVKGRWGYQSVRILNWFRSLGF